jgi:transposase
LKELEKTMGLSIRVFIVENDDTIKRLPLARYERLLRRDPDERLSRYAGQRVRYALIVVNLVNRKPIAVVKDEYAYLDFDKEGRFKEPVYEEVESSPLDMLDILSFEQKKDRRVIDARHKFARKRYFDKNRWEPTDEIATAIAEAIFGKLI